MNKISVLFALVVSSGLAVAKVDHSSYSGCHVELVAHAQEQSDFYQPLAELNTVLKGRSRTTLLVRMPMKAAQVDSFDQQFWFTNAAGLTAPRALRVIEDGHLIFVIDGGVIALRDFATRLAQSRPNDSIGFQVLDSMVKGAAEIHLVSPMNYTPIDSASPTIESAFNALLDQLPFQPDHSLMILDRHLKIEFDLFGAGAVQRILDSRALSKMANIEVVVVSPKESIARALDLHSEAFKGAKAFALRFRGGFLTNQAAAVKLLELKGERAPAKPRATVHVAAELRSLLKNCIENSPRGSCLSAPVPSSTPVPTPPTSLSPEPAPAPVVSELPPGKVSEPQPPRKRITGTLGLFRKTVEEDVPAEKAPPPTTLPPVVQSSAPAEKLTLADLGVLLPPTMRFDSPIQKPAPREKAPTKSNTSARSTIPTAVATVASSEPEVVTPQAQPRELPASLNHEVMVSPARLEALGTIRANIRPLIMSERASAVMAVEDNRVRVELANLADALDAELKDLQSVEEYYEVEEDSELREILVDDHRRHVETIATLNGEVDRLLDSSANHAEDTIIIELTRREGAGDLEFGDLEKMYLNLARRRGWTLEKLDSSSDKHGVFHSVLRVEGAGVRQLMTTERGTHRFMAMHPKTSKEITHYVDVSVYREPNAGETKIDENDFEIRIMSASGSPGHGSDSAVVVTHKKTGISAKIESRRSPMKNRTMALAIVSGKVREIAERAEREKLQALRTEGGSLVAEGRWTRLYDMRAKNAAGQHILYGEGLDGLMKKAQEILIERRLGELADSAPQMK